MDPLRGEAVLVIGQLHRGGAEGQLVNLALGLRGSAYTPVVACLSHVSEPHASRLSDAGVAVEIFPRRRSGELARLRSLRRFLRSRKAAVIHSWLVGANAYAYGASRWSGAPPVVASSRTTMKMPDPVRRRIHGWVFRHADAVIANSATVKSFTSSYYRVAPERIHVVPNGVDVARFPGAARDGAAFRREAGIGESELLVGSVGRLSAEKGLETLIEAAAGVASRRPGVRFLLAGDGPERGRLEALAGRRAPGAGFLFTGARSDVPAILAALDLFVLTSRTEGLSNAVMEAMASGLPVIATRVGGMDEVIDHGATGRLVAPGDPEALRAELIRLLEDPREREALGRAGRERIMSGFSLEAMVGRTVQVYEGVGRAR